MFFPFLPEFRHHSPFDQGSHLLPIDNLTGNNVPNPHRQYKSLTEFDKANL